MAAILTPSFIAADDRQYQRTDKIDRVWIAENIKLSDYEVLVVEPTATGPEVKVDNEKEKERLEEMKGTIQQDLIRALKIHRVAPEVTDKPDVGTNKRVLRLVNTITRFKKGSTATRVLVGMGTGLPYVQIRGELIPVGATAPVLIYELDETASIMGSGYRGSRGLQTETSSDLTSDVAEFLSKVARDKPIAFKKARKK